MSDLPPGEDVSGRHYLRGTVASGAVDYALCDQGLIKEAFNTGNFTDLRSAIPLELAADQVALLRRHRMEANRVCNWNKMTNFNNGKACTGRGLFYPEFDFVPEPPNQQEEARAAEKETHQKAMKKISEVTWRPTGDGGGVCGASQIAYLAASSAGSNAVPDSGTGGKDGKEEEQGVPQNGVFRCGKGQGLNDEGRNSRQQLGHIIVKLRDKLTVDWSGCVTAVHATADDLVEISFLMEGLDSELGVFCYMNLLAKSSWLVDCFGLRKLSQLWGVKREFSGSGGSGLTKSGVPGEDKKTWIFFLLAPKWVKMRVTDAYYTRHPREAGSLFRMSVPGSSILYSLSNQ